MRGQIGRKLPTGMGTYINDVQFFFVIFDLLCLEPMHFYIDATPVTGPHQLLVALWPPPLNRTSLITLFESKNERQEIEPVPIPLPTTSRDFPDVKTRNEKKIYNWTSEIIPFISFGKQMDKT